MSKKKPTPPGPRSDKPVPCAKRKNAPEEETKAPKKKALFRIVPVDPKNTLSFEDTADK